MSDIRKRVGSKGTTYQVRYPNAKCKSGYAYATFRTLKEARDFLESGGARKNGAGKSKSVAEAVQLWLDICEKIGRDGRESIEPQTLLEYRRRARAMTDYAWGKTIGELEPADIVQFRTWLLQNHSRDMARRTLSSFHSVLIEMRTQGYVTHDPAAGICVRSDGRHEEKEVEIPTDDEMRAILAAADAMGRKNDYMRKRWERYRPLIYLAAFSGLRPSEVRGLLWSNVGNGFVDVTQRADATGLIGPVKSKAARRRIHLPALVSDMLEVWRLTSGGTDEQLVFPTETGKPMMLRNLRGGCWIPLLKEAGLAPDGEAKYTLYALRHYFASKLIENGSDLKYIQEVMGHSKIEITLNVYSHLIRGKDKERNEFANHLITSVLGN